MKKMILLLLVVFLINTASFTQTLDGYKYVYVPNLTYTNGGIDIWNISGMLRTWFSEKGFIVLTESSSPNDEIKQDGCLVLNCEINHTNVMSGTNTVTIRLKNCQQQVVYNKTGSAMGWSLQDDYNKATRRAYEDIKSMSYSFNPDKTISKNFLSSLPTLELTGYTEESIKKYFSENSLDPVEGIYKSYQSGALAYYKLGIIKAGDKFKVVVLDTELSHWKKGELKAVLEPSSMKGFYSVKWYMGDKTPYETFGSMDNPALLSIELKDPNTGEKKQDKFIKLFPAAAGDITFKKDNSKSSGSGFFVTTDGIVATNAHVIEGASKIEVTVSNEIGNFTYKAKVLLVDNKNDVALLQVDDQSFKGLSNIPFGIVENSDVGSKVFTIGYPLNDVMGANFKVTDGIISSKSGIADDIRYYQISVPIQPGNSGGPLFNKDGNVIGITSARLNSKAVGTQVENVNYAIKSSYLLNLFNMLPNSPKISGTSQVSSKELQEQVKVLKNYVCLIKVY
jgi:S1-C subfamily serine protease